MPLFRRNVSSIGEAGDKVSGDVTLVEGSNVTITRSGQNIEIAATGSGGPATTDDLPEGVVNLYFTEQRAVDATESLIIAMATVL